MSGNRLVTMIFGIVLIPLQKPFLAHVASKDLCKFIEPFTLHLSYVVILGLKTVNQGVGVQKTLSLVILSAGLSLALVFTPSANAQTVPSKPPDSKTQQAARSSTARIVEDVPGPNQSTTAHLIRVKAGKTPSGFNVPRYVSLKYSKSNGRSGPSSEHPVIWRYTRRGLPMIVVAETEVWRKVRDVNGDESWMKRRLLDGKRMVLARSGFILRAKPRSDSKNRAFIGKGVLLELRSCDINGWCKVHDANRNIGGYALQTLLWGAEPL